jgi:uncharacterized protein (UPF0264 family)
LASAASAGEAVAALRAGAAVIDLKNPRLGPLGACREATLRAARRRCLALDPARPMSAAAGPAVSPAAARVAAQAARLGYDYVKCGLEGIATPGAAVAALRRAGRAARAASPRVRLIAATYADAAIVKALPPALLPAVAARAGFDGCLLDTAAKAGPGLADLVSADAIAAFIAACRRAGLLCALAGSLRAVALRRVPALLEADLIGARGALCEGGRAGRISPLRVRTFSLALAAAVAARKRAAPRGRDARRSPAPPSPPPGAARTEGRRRPVAPDPRARLLRSPRADRAPARS